jgi:hypothetical protein
MNDLNNLNLIHYLTSHARSFTPEEDKPSRPRMKVPAFLMGVLFGLLLLVGGLAAESVFTALGGANNPVNVVTPPGGAADVFVQDQTTVPVEYLMYRELNDITITAPVGSRENTLVLSPGHGMVAGDFVNVYQVDNNFLGIGATRYSFQQLEAVSVVVDTIRTDKYMGFDLDPAKVVFAKRVSVEQNVLGTIDAPVKFELCVPPDLVWDLTRIMPTMVLATQPDDGLFGDIAALTNGVIYGFESDVFDSYLLSIKANAGYKASAFDVNYSARSGGSGSWGMVVRKSFSGADKYGVTIRLESGTTDCFVKYVQDDLTGLNIFRDKLMGHNTSDSPLVILPE